MTVFIFRCWNLEILTDYGLPYIPGAFAIMRRVFDWKRSRISVMDVQAVPQNCIL
jgi:hypothetical protein